MERNIIMLVLLLALTNIVYAMKQEQINSYFLEICQLDPYQEDAKKVARVPRALFQQLCVQASSSQEDRESYFQSLLTKLRLQKIKLKYSPIYITPKDLARILINIPTDKSYSTINGKQAKLEVTHYETEEDKEDNALIETFKITGCKYDEKSDFFYKERNQSSIPDKYTINNGPQKSGFQLASDYDFESDATHHQHIVEQFNNLIAFK
jgi:hypothetical protein